MSYSKEDIFGLETKLDITPNQAKVICEKYIKDKEVRELPYGPEKWLRGVANKIALTEVLYLENISKDELFNGINHKVREEDTGEEKSSIMHLIHDGLKTHDERDSNYRKFVNKLREVAETNEDAKKIVSYYEDRFYGIMSGWKFLPNSPALMNAWRDYPGLGKLAKENNNQYSACFVFPVEDSVDGWMKTAWITALTHKTGGGTGFSAARVRPKGDTVKTTQGVASGALSIFNIVDAVTEEIKQGSVRRGANMGILPYHHPDIIDFINMKAILNNKNSKIYNKIKKVLEENYSIDEKNPKDKNVLELITKTFLDEQLRNFNISVGLDQRFFKAVKEDSEYELINPHTKKIVGKKKAREVFNLIVKHAWETGDPGYVMLDIINDSESNPTPKLGQIESTNPCITGDALIATNKGLIRMEKLINNPTSIATDIRVHNKNTLLIGIKFERTPGAWLTGIKPVFKLITKRGFEINTTSDHKISTFEGWKKLEDIKIGNKILIQSGASLFNNEENLPALFNNTTKWTKEIGQILGWLIGDGWFRDKDKNCRAGFTFGKDDINIFNYLKPIINKIYGKEIKEVRKENGTIQISYHSKKFVEFLKELGIKPIHSDKKIVPESILTATKEAVVGFLQGLFSSDGTISTHHKNKTYYIRLTSKSEKLLKGIQLLLLNLGIISKIYGRHRNRRVIFNYKTIRGELRLYESDGILYELQISKDMIPKFLSEIGFLCDKNKDKISTLEKVGFYSSNFYDEVISIEPMGLQKVYDLSEPNSHSFIANGIVTHNCGEKPLLPNEPCNLGSLNVAKFVKYNNEKPYIDYKDLEETTKLATIFLDDVIDVNNYPTDEVEIMAKGNRRIGLGIMGWAEMLVLLGIPYDSEGALKLGGEVMGFIEQKATEQSIELAKRKGVFPFYKESIFDKDGEYFKGNELKPRNCVRTTIAPTGTISNCAGLQGAGIEPFYSLAYDRLMAPGQDQVERGEKIDDKYIMHEFNPLLEKVLEENNYFGLDKKTLWEKIEKNHGSIKGLNEIPENIQGLFRTAHDINYEWHIRHQVVFQKNTGDGVSKTINFPNSATIEDIRNAYLLAAELGLKGITIYRDGCKSIQTLISHIEKKGNIENLLEKERPNVRGTTVKFDSPFGKGFLTYNIVNGKDNHPYETFINVGKAGGDIQAISEGYGRLMSLLLKKGVKIEEIIEQLAGIGGNSQIGHGENNIKSLPDAIAIALEKAVNSIPINSVQQETQKKLIILESYDLCNVCGAKLKFEEGCKKCTLCGWSGCP